MNAREKEKKKTAIRAAAKKGSFQDNEKNGGERGEPLATEERPPRSFKRGFSMVREMNTRQELVKLRLQPEAERRVLVFFFRTIVTIISCVIVVKSSGLRTSLST